MKPSLKNWLMIIGGIIMTNTACTHPAINLSKAKTIELVVWQPVPGVSEEEVRAKALAVSDFLKKQPGFLYRDLAKNTEGEWVDYIYWENDAAADLALEASQESALCAPFFAVIDMEKAKMSRYQSLGKSFP